MRNPSQFILKKLRPFNHQALLKLIKINSKDNAFQSHQQGRLTKRNRQTPTINNTKTNKFQLKNID